MGDIRLSIGEDLNTLLRHPKELATLIAIVSGKTVTMSSNEVLKLKKLGFITANGGVKKSLISSIVKSNQSNKIDNLSLMKIALKRVPQKERNYWKVSKAFWELFQSNLIKLKARHVHLSGATYKKWVDPIRLMIEVDKVTFEELREVWVFLRGHPFWGSNIQTTTKLRKQFSTLHAQSKTPQNEKGNKENTNGIARTVSNKFVTGIINDLQPD